MHLAKFLVILVVVYTIKSAECYKLTYKDDEKVANIISNKYVDGERVDEPDQAQAINLLKNMGFKLDNKNKADSRIVRLSGQQFIPKDSNEDNIAKENTESEKPNDNVEEEKENQNIEDEKSNQTVENKENEKLEDTQKENVQNTENENVKDYDLNEETSDNDEDYEIEIEDLIELNENSNREKSDDSVSRQKESNRRRTQDDRFERRKPIRRIDTDLDNSRDDDVSTRHDSNTYSLSSNLNQILNGWNKNSKPKSDKDPYFMNKHKKISHIDRETELLKMLKAKKRVQVKEDSEDNESVEDAADEEEDENEDDNDNAVANVDDDEDDEDDDETPIQIDITKLIKPLRNHGRSKSLYDKEKFVYKPTSAKSKKPVDIYITNINQNLNGKAANTTETPTTKDSD